MCDCISMFDRSSPAFEALTFGLLIGALASHGWVEDFIKLPNFCTLLIAEL